MKTPADVRAVLVKRFRSKKAQWLAGLISGIPEGGGWPLEIGLDVPTEREVLADWRSALQWADAWKAETDAAGFVQWGTRTWRHGGRQDVPEKLILARPDEAAEWAGEARRWQRAVRRAEAFLDAFPGTETELTKHWDVLADWEEGDFVRLRAFLTWLTDHRASGLYVRQLPIEGADTKWLTEPRKRTVCALLIAVLAAAGEPIPDASDFETLCGLRTKPVMLRIRLLDPALRRAVGGLEDIRAPSSELARLSLTPAVVLFSENEATGLALPDMPQTVAVFGQGNDIATAASVPWIAAAKILYWGDLDTYGFRILAEARRRFPDLTSVLMDRTTLETYLCYAVTEPQQTPETELPDLTPDEAAVYALLRENRLGDRVRLEQERIPWAYATEQLFGAHKRLLQA